MPVAIAKRRGFDDFVALLEREQVLLFTSISSVFFVKVIYIS